MDKKGSGWGPISIAVALLIAISLFSLTCQYISTSKEIQATCVDISKTLVEEITRSDLMLNKSSNATT